MPDKQITIKEPVIDSVPDGVLSFSAELRGDTVVARFVYLNDMGPMSHALVLDDQEIADLRVALKPLLTKAKVEWGF